MAVIIPIHSGYSRPMTEHGAKVLAGCFIILCVIWAITTTYFLIKYQKDNQGKYLKNSFSEEFFFGDNILLSVYNCMMTFLVGTHVLVYLGEQVANFL